MLADEFEQVSEILENDTKRLFLVAGELYEHPLHSWLEESIIAKLAYFLQSYARSEIGYATVASGYILSHDTVLAPDIGFIRSARFPTQIPDGFFPAAPDLAVEVLPSDTSQKPI